MPRQSDHRTRLQTECPALAVSGRFEQTVAPGSWLIEGFIAYINATMA
jgi:hypothetical protein